MNRPTQIGGVYTWPKAVACKRLELLMQQGDARCNRQFVRPALASRLCKLRCRVLWIRSLSVSSRLIFNSRDFASQRFIQLCCKPSTAQRCLQTYCQLLHGVASLGAQVLGLGFFEEMSESISQDLSKVAKSSTNGFCGSRVRGTWLTVLR